MMYTQQPESARPPRRAGARPFFFAINRSSSGQNKESELLIAATALQAASWLLRGPHPRAAERTHQFSTRVRSKTRGSP